MRDEISVKALGLLEISFRMGGMKTNDRNAWHDR